MMIEIKLSKYQFDILEEELGALVMRDESPSESKLVIMSVLALMEEAYNRL